MNATSFSMLSEGTQFRLVSNTKAPIYTKKGCKGLLNGPKDEFIRVSGSTTVHTL